MNADPKHLAQIKAATRAAWVTAQADGVMDPGEKAAIQAHAERVRDGADAVLAGLNAPKLRAVV